MMRRCVAVDPQLARTCRRRSHPARRFARGPAPGAGSLSDCRTCSPRGRPASHTPAAIRPAMRQSWRCRSRATDSHAGSCEQESMRKLVYVSGSEQDRDQSPGSTRQDLRQPAPNGSLQQWCRYSIWTSTEPMPWAGAAQVVQRIRRPAGSRWSRSTRTAALNRALDALDKGIEAARVRLDIGIAQIADGLQTSPPAAHASSRNCPRNCNKSKTCWQTANPIRRGGSACCTRPGTGCFRYRRPAGRATRRTCR